jgi:hypothetical protein
MCKILPAVISYQSNMNNPCQGYLQNALEEISMNKGKTYDPAAVDACIKLFKEKSFILEE